MCAPWLELARALMKDNHLHPSQCFLLPALWRAVGSCRPWWALLLDGPLWAPSWSISVSLAISMSRVMGISYVPLMSLPPSATGTQWGVLLFSSPLVGASPAPSAWDTLAVSPLKSAPFFPAASTVRCSPVSLLWPWPSHRVLGTTMPLKGHWFTPILSLGCRFQGPCHPLGPYAREFPQPQGTCIRSLPPQVCGTGKAKGLPESHAAAAWERG